MLRPRSSVTRFLINRPGVSAALILSASVLAMLIPYVGPVLGLIILAGGLGGIAFLRISVRRELEPSERRLALPSTPPHSPSQLGLGHQPLAGPPQLRADPQSIQPTSQITQFGRNPTRSRSQQLRNVVAIASQMPLDPRPRTLDEQIEVAGETHHTRQIRAIFRESQAIIEPKGTTLRGLTCVLVPEPWNDYDENAIAVVIGNQQVGHIPAELAEDYSPPLRAIAQAGFLVAGDARIWAKVDDGMVWARVTIAVPAADTL